MPDHTFLFRTEDLQDAQIREFYVPTRVDADIVQHLKNTNPTILEGTRGTGKSFLLRVAEIELRDSFVENRILPVYVSFVRSSLVRTNDPSQFRNWMIAKLCSRIIRAANKHGLIVPTATSITNLAGGPNPAIGITKSGVDTVAEAYEESYRHPERNIDATNIPSIEALRDGIEDLCEELNITRLVILFDEATHIFRPEQQRQFFTLFRDLRAPHVTCNAAVYPGVTSYGPTFQPAHDATFLRLDRNPLDGEYVSQMREIVEKQAPSDLLTHIERRGENFASLVYAVGGNPRWLLKTLARASALRDRDVSEVIKSFYRSDIWGEHLTLGETYPGHAALVEWGHNFVVDTVLPATKEKNDQWREKGLKQATCYFWMNRNAPAAITQAIRLLEYTGIVTKGEEWVRTTRGETGTRYALNLGCLFALEANPTKVALQLVRSLTPRRFTEYGANHPAYESLTIDVSTIADPDPTEILQSQLIRTIDVLDITDFQKSRLRELGMETVGDVLQADEKEFQQAYYVGPFRSRQISNAAHASVLEYLSG